MNDAPSPPPRPFARRMLALSLPYLPTDRILRQLNGRSWLTAPTPSVTVGQEALAKFSPLSLGGRGL